MWALKLLGTEENLPEPQGLPPPNGSLATKAII